MFNHNLSKRLLAGDSPQAIQNALDGVHDQGLRGLETTRFPIRRDGPLGPSPHAATRLRIRWARSGPAGEKEINFSLPERRWHGEAEIGLPRHRRERDAAADAVQEPRRRDGLGGRRGARRGPAAAAAARVPGRVQRVGGELGADLPPQPLEGGRDVPRDRRAAAVEAGRGAQVAQEPVALPRGDCQDVLDAYSPARQLSCRRED